MEHGDTSDLDGSPAPHPEDAGAARATGLGRRRFAAALLAAATLRPTVTNSTRIEADPRVDPRADFAGREVVPSFRGPRPEGWAEEFRAEWSAYAQRYVMPDGRVVDTANRGISHSEGQGSALLFAAEANDLPSFERILGWTMRNLRRRSDNLLAWRFQPGLSTPVTDTNNATDGDILMAWALQRGAERFGRPDFAEQAERIARDILSVCTRRVASRLVLLPGAQGFERHDHVVLNPSYYIFPALLDFAALVPGPAWRQLVEDGLHLTCREGVFGRWNLPADWIEVSRDPGRPVRLFADRPPRFSWDAVRVPLNLAWGRQSSEPALRACAGFWTDPGHGGRLPAWVDLREDRLAPYPGHAGIQAVAALAGAARQPAAARRLPGVRDSTDYYGASLVLMARIARVEAQREEGADIRQS
ncbi:glycosyl hydrolase family 8 [Roseomonas sp. CCTCC AB2023176]|uniref:glycosyl hydrolase family 8 n=1 Tax=Roseomonas sp. CCTCC AB2023176 TaxID=3342640 RepID=UPI0035E263E8